VNDRQKPLTDHAQATAEIAKRDAVIELHSKTLERIARQDIPGLQTEFATLRSQLSTALAESGEIKRGWESACAFIDSHVADPDITDEMWATYSKFVRIRDSLARHTTTQESADNG
jgi:hypothetical protein